MIWFIISCFIAYTISSLNFAIILSKLLKLPDPRTVGSGNAGTTNILRYSSKKIAIAVFILDVLKGTLAIYIAKLLGITPQLLGFVALTSILGHIYPCFYKFKGGKGVATALGCFLVLAPTLGILLLVIWLLTAALFRYSSLASIISLFCAPVLSFILYPEILIPTITITIIVISLHKDNIYRIYHKSESKIA